MDFPSKRPITDNGWPVPDVAYVAHSLGVDPMRMDCKDEVRDDEGDYPTTYRHRDLKERAMLLRERLQVVRGGNWVPVAKGSASLAYRAFCRGYSGKGKKPLLFGWRNFHEGMETRRKLKLTANLRNPMIE